MKLTKISATLGPTNTGKTFSAIEKLLSYPNGVIGFPLRLLARENFDFVKKLFRFFVTFTTNINWDYIYVFKFI